MRSEVLLKTLGKKLHRLTRFDTSPFDPESLQIKATFEYEPQIAAVQKVDTANAMFGYSIYGNTTVKKSGQRNW